MLIPKFWAEHKISFPHKNKIAMIKRYGWSNTDQDSAKNHAIERCEFAKQTLQSGTAVKRIEGKDAYLETWGLPIREEIVSEYPGLKCVTTINNYGAICLNVENVMIFDCDNEDIIFHAQNKFNLKKPKILGTGWQLLISFVLITFSTYSAMQFIDNKLWIVALFFVFWLGWALLITLTFERWENYHLKKWLIAQGGYNGLLENFLHNFLKNHPQFAFNIYQTPNGFRLIETNHLATPDSDIANLCFTQLPVDNNYTHLCKIQHCYRARVTGKPWRMGMAKIPFRYFWLTEEPDFIQRTQWLEQYQQKVGDFSACYLIKTLGNAKPTPKIKAITDLHDELCQARTTLPMA